MADIFSSIFNFFWYLWDCKIQIIGSVFIVLSAYDYLYKSYIIHSSRSKIKQIEKIILHTSSIMAAKKSNSDLEHEFLEYKINKIANDVTLNIHGLRTEIRAEFEVINIRFDGFAKFAENAKEDIKKLKDDTAFIGASKKWKWVVGLAIIGLITTVNFEQIKTWVNKLIPW